MGVVYEFAGLFRERLQRLEQAWVDQGAPIAEHLAPGATEAHLDEIEHRVGCALVPELRAWWGWHDGVVRRQPGTLLGRETRIGPGGWEFLSSTEAVQERDRRRADWGVGNAGDSDENWQGQWRTEWLPFLTFDAYALFIDCRQVSPVGTSPVRRYDHTPDDVFTPIAGALYQAVGVWMYLLEERYYEWDPDQQGWVDRYQEIPLPLREMF